MSALPEFVRLDSSLLTLMLDCRGRTPAILYFGGRLSSNTTPQMLGLLRTRQEAKCSVVHEAAIGLTPLSAEGFTGAPGIELSDATDAWAFGPQLDSIDQCKTADGQQQVTFVSTDALRQLQLTHVLTLDLASHVVSLQTSLKNLGAATRAVHWCAAGTILLPDHVQELTSFEGRWSNEFQRRRQPLTLGSFVRENRKGKTSHDTYPALLVHSHTTSEQSGEVYGFHLGWSGNHSLRAELTAEGRHYVQFGELLLPGEVTLTSGESYQSPLLYLSYAAHGFSQLSQQFHHFVRSRLLSLAQQQKARPVHYNTWEGIYFNHDTETLMQLATRVAQLGVERFVLDDGWFLGRRGDFAGLGDWQVDPAVYPQGLAPLISHVNALGMEFGLWFEPEMVNPDSELYRAHPEWVLGSENNPQMRFRNQLVLDLSRPEVSAYLYDCIHALLNQYPQIRYIKWDMNRDLNHPSGADGKPAVHRQVLAVYQLISRLKAAHPGLEIESCCSGGGRADYGVLAHTDRIWTSDSNDALDRLNIQRGCSFFLPADVMGAHVGPRDCHITGRRVSMEMRCAVALFGHFGIEMDPRELTEAESKTLSQAIAFYKTERSFMRSAVLQRLDSDGDSINFGLVAPDQKRAIFAYNSVKETGRTMPPRLRFAGLNAKVQYRLMLAWPSQLKEYSASVLKVAPGEIFSGDALMQFGLQLPILHPQSSLIFILEQQ